jgi:hypothetical protein
MSSRLDRYFLPQIGWLFADLLLVLAIIFLISNVPQELEKKQPTPTPSHTATPTLTPVPIDSLVLDKQYTEIPITVDNPVLLSHGDPGAKNSLREKVRIAITKLNLQNRRAGLVIAYGGTGGNTDGTSIQQATDVSRNTYDVLQDLGVEKFVFCKSTYYDPVISLKNPANLVVMHIYLFNSYFPAC